MDSKKPAELPSGKSGNVENPAAAEQAENQAQERILKNTSYLTIAFVLQKILSFLYFIFISRVLGPVDLGLYDPVKSLIPILLILIDFSLSVVLVREISRKPANAEEYLGNVLGIKVFFALVVLLAMGLFTNFSGYATLAKTILYLDAVIVVLDTFTLTFFAVFRGMQNMAYESLGMIVTQFLTVVVGVTGLLMGWDIRVLFFAVLTGSVFNFVFSSTVLRRKLKIRIRLQWNWQVIKVFLKTAVPFAVAAILVKIYTYTDRFMLLAIAGQRSVGWYAIAHKYTYALEFLPSAFAASIFPAMSAFYLSSREKLAKTFENAMHYLILLSLPISFAIFTLADKIIVSLSGDAYATSVLPLRILISGLVVVFLNFPVGAFLNACNRQVINTFNMLITVCINVALNILLIREYTIVGAAISALVSGVVLFFLGLRQVNRVISYDKKRLLMSLIKTFVAAAIMAGVLTVLKLSVNISVHFTSSPLLEKMSVLLPLSVYIVIGFVVYVLCLFLVKGVTLGDFKILYQKIIKRLS